jgi:hypothetical protein
MNSETSTLQLNQEKRQKEPQNNDARKTVGATGFEPRVAVYLLPYPASVGSTRGVSHLGKQASRRHHGCILFANERR